MAVHPLPLGPDQASLPTVADVLSLPELVAGEAAVVAGERGLAREVRWAHVVAGTGAVALLDGGELVLTTGAGWPTDNSELEALATQLVSSGPAAVALELVSNFSSPPEALVAECDRAEIPLIALHREVRFVQITQRVHQRILSTQSAALQARAEVHAMLTELGLNRSPVDYVVERLADTLAAPVVLEDPAHRVVAWATGGTAARTMPTAAPAPAPTTPTPTLATPPLTTPPLTAPTSDDPALLLAPWATPPGTGFTPDPKWDRVPVEARGTRWGYLTALPGQPHPAGRRTVLELGAFALALARLADTEGAQWQEYGSKRIFEALLGGRYRSDTEIATQLAASGLPVEGRVLLGATLTGVGDFGAHSTLERAVLETGLRRAVAPEGRVIITGAPGTTGDGPALLALLSLPEGDPRIGTGNAPHSTTPLLAVRLARELDMLIPSPTPASWRAHLGLGAPAQRVRPLVASIEQVRAAGRLPAIASTGRVTVQQAERQPLAYLVRGLSSNPEVQEFATETLGPLIDHDLERGPGHTGDLLRVLAAYLEHPTNRSLAAQRARLSRSVFYQRLALIEDLLAIDLTDGTTIATLSVALLAHR
ncbi:PucR family transcriptional regulator [Leucobacter sp. GX24907]